ncbi:MAG: OmpH family outer membrane protein [Rhodospirillales bacterium]|jgi:outer membrane protein|nr:OmpH family outer membrane protein [Rhodospirillales bacterium]MBT4038686.1 OmpH family outer membrane protein [Rhodospirillales bacterium]MBT4627791.1 OmpH family outer membrane protein [Rhodospirillales bacterium]MBT5350417.1 OmpH family outer membrane protein [Rhodospirillales bacterium]MBT5519235.1 OmpH family outer membrane protein [Rhodospirillales bacterium]
MLTKIARLVVVSAMLLAPLSMAFAQDTTAPEDKSLRIAVINMKLLRKSSTAMQGIREQVSSVRATYQAQVQTENEELRAASEELARQRTILGAEAFAAERRKFEASVADVQRMTERRRDDLKLVRDQATAEVQVVLNEVITTIAKERNLGLILPREQIIFVNSSLDLTAELITRLNAALPSVTVPQPGQ